MYKIILSNRISAYRNKPFTRLCWNKIENVSKSSNEAEIILTVRTLHEWRIYKRI